MNEKLQRLSAKMVGLFPEDFKSAQDCYDQFRDIYKKQFKIFRFRNFILHRRSDGKTPILFN
jgi:hypothetical protein